MIFCGKPPCTSQTPSATLTTLGLNSDRVTRVRALKALVIPRSAALARGGSMPICRANWVPS